MVQARVGYPFKLANVLPFLLLYDFKLLKTFNAITRTGQYKVFFNVLLTPPHGGC